MTASRVSRHTFPKAARVRSRLDFTRVYENGLRRGDGVLLLTACRSDWPLARLGLAVSKRCGNAVQRNRWKRLIREAFRRLRNELPCGIDFVVQPRVPQPPSLDELQRSLHALTKRLAKKMTEEASSQSQTSRTPAENKERS